MLRLFTTIMLTTCLATMIHIRTAHANQCTGNALVPYEQLPLVHDFRYPVSCQSDHNLNMSATICGNTGAPMTPATPQSARYATLPDTIQQLEAGGYEMTQVFGVPSSSTLGWCRNQNYREMNFYNKSDCEQNGYTWMWGHDGIDINRITFVNGVKHYPNDTGHRICASAAGQVVMVHNDPYNAWGRHIIILHHTRFGRRYSFYGHLERILVTECDLVS